MVFMCAVSCPSRWSSGAVETVTLHWMQSQTRPTLDSVSTVDVSCDLNRKWVWPVTMAPQLYPTSTRTALST